MLTVLGWYLAIIPMVGIVTALVARQQIGDNPAELTGSRLAWLKKSGGSIVGRANFNASLRDDCYVTFSCAVPLIPGDYLELYVYQTSGGPLNLNGGLYATYVAIERSA